MNDDAPQKMQEWQSRCGQAVWRVMRVDTRERTVKCEAVRLPDDSLGEPGDTAEFDLDQFIDEIGSQWFLSADVPERDWEVTWGFYCDRRVYRGPSTFLAGLNYARVHRKGCRIDVGGRAYRVLDMLTLDEGGDDQTEEETEFFERCADIGSRFKWRGSFDHSKNWKTKEEWARLEADRRELEQYFGRSR